MPLKSMTFTHSALRCRISPFSPYHSKPMEPNQTWSSSCVFDRIDALSP